MTSAGNSALRITVKLVKLDCTTRPSSGIDLTLLGGIDLPTLNRTSLEPDDLLLLWKIDLSAYALSNNPEPLDHIQRVGQAFYRRKGKNKSPKVEVFLALNARLEKP